MKNSPFDTVIDRRHTDSIKWQKFNPGVIPMWIADMEFATSSVITEALSKRIKHPIFGYTETPESLINSVVSYCAKNHNWKIDTDGLYWIPGVVPAITAACRIAGKPGDEIIVMTPVYQPLLEIPTKIGKSRIDVPLVYSKDEQNHCGRWSIDFDVLEAAFSSRTSALLLSSPHNPMGVMFTEDELYRVSTLCAKHNVLLISDEIHCDLILSKTKKHIPTVQAAGEHHHTVLTVMSPSKTFNLAGANCSFAYTTDSDVMKRFSEECLYTVPLVPTLSYCAAEAAYSDGWDWHSELINYLRGNHDYLHSAINSSELLSMDSVEATYLGWIDTSRVMSEDACDFFKSAGVGLSPGSQFGNQNYQRINFACSREQLETGVDRILKAIRDHQK